jgi:4-alpha-glucanotransferase
MFSNRGCGVLMHLTSLPGAAFRFADFLAAAGQSYWQILPLNPTDAGSQHSPYSVLSAFAADPMFIDSSQAVDRKGFEKFQEENEYWLEDYATFAVLKNHFQRRPWYAWPAELRDRKPDAMNAVHQQLGAAIQRERELQFLFEEQWFGLKIYCNQKGIQIIGDLPIYVNHDSSDCWVHPELFELDSQGQATFIAGVPPDRFSATGQRWGNPVYRWAEHRKTHYEWWIERMKRCLYIYDVVRIDHFRGFAQFWSVPANEKTAQNGKWENGPRNELFDALLQHFPKLPVIAEDLGTITPDVRELMERYEFPGMKLLLFAFTKKQMDHPSLPHNHIQNCVVYTGTHDNNTVRGWFEHEATAEEIARAEKYIGHPLSTDSVHWDFVRMAISSVADVVIIPMQDLLGLGEDARMNRPASSTGNWQWRMREEQLTAVLAEQVSALVKIYNRQR